MEHRTIGRIAVLLTALGIAACGSSTTLGTSTPTPVTTLGAHYPVGRIGDVVASDAAIWVLDNDNTGRLNRFDPNSKSIVASIPVGRTSQPSRGEIAFNDFDLWLAYPSDGLLTHIDPHSDLVTAQLHLAPAQLGPIAVSPEAVWAASTSHNTLTRIDPATGAVAATIAVPTTPTSVT